MPNLGQGKTRKLTRHAGFDGILMELLTGIEPVTSSLPRMRAAGCATEAVIVLYLLRTIIIYKKILFVKSIFYYFFIYV